MPVTMPTLAGNSFFINAGISTLPTVMAAPINAAPKNKRYTFPEERINRPKANINKEYRSNFSKPNFRATLGAKADSSAKEIKGMAVRSPINAGDRLIFSDNSVIIGPTEVMGARRLAARNMIPNTIITISNLVFLVGLSVTVALVSPFMTIYCFLDGKGTVYYYMNG